MVAVPPWTIGAAVLLAGIMLLLHMLHEPSEQTGDEAPIGAMGDAAALMLSGFGAWLLWIGPNPEPAGTWIAIAAGGATGTAVMLLSTKSRWSTTGDRRHGDRRRDGNHADPAGQHPRVRIGQQRGSAAARTPRGPTGSPRLRPPATRTASTGSTDGNTPGMPTRHPGPIRVALWSWPAGRGRTADPLDRLALEPVTLDGPRTEEPEEQAPTHLAWAHQIEEQTSTLHRVAFSTDLAPRTAGGLPIAPHQRLAIEAVETADNLPAGQYAPAPADRTVEPDETAIAVPVDTAGRRHALVVRVDGRNCPDPRGWTAYNDDTRLARCLDIEEALDDERLSGVNARQRALETIVHGSGIDVSSHYRPAILVAPDGAAVTIPDPGRAPLSAALHRLHGAAIGLARRAANENAGSPRDRNLQLLAAAWAATHTSQAAAAGLHTIRCNQALARAAAAVRKDPGAFRQAVALAAETEERLVRPVRETRGRQVEEETPERERRQPANPESPPPPARGAHARQPARARTARGR